MVRDFLQEQLDRIYKRELELIKQGQDPETAHAVAVAEDSLPELERLKRPSQEAGVIPSKQRT
jgi:hypothetical protein